MKKDNNSELMSGSKSERDTLFASPGSGMEKFSFDENVVKVFDDMIHRSVPGYDAILSMIGVLAEHYVSENSRCYDLGCSLGGVTFNILNSIKQRQCEIIAVDNSEAMVTKLRERLMEQGYQSRVVVRQEDIRDTKVVDASMVVLNFVLQFLEPAQRTPILQKIYNGMLPGSVLVLSEKIDFENKSESNFQIDMYHDFKKLQGYSDLEISQKRAALEKVLVPDTQSAHIQRLKDIGFNQVYLWFQCFNFISIVAIK